MKLLIKIVSIALTSGILSLILKKEHKEFSILIVIAGTFAILMLTYQNLSASLSYAKNTVLNAGLNLKYIKIIMKVIVIAYISEYGSALLSDMGEEALAKKVEISGKIIIFTFTIPLLNELSEVIFSLV